LKTLPKSGRVALRLVLCRACKQFVRPGEADCPHCGACVAAAERQYQACLREARSAARELRKLMAKLAEE
jgi:hypothetical protein